MSYSWLVGNNLRSTHCRWIPEVDEKNFTNNYLKSDHHTDTYTKKKKKTKN